MPAAGVLLDVDGTLVDTNYLHTLSWWRALRSLGVTVPMARIHPLIGMGGDQLVPELFGHEVDGADDAYGVEFARLRGEAVALPGARDLVRTLADAGLTVVLASSSREDDLDHMRGVVDADEWIAGATSSADIDASKPDAEVFVVAMEENDLDAASTIAIGDSVWDGEAARRSGIGFVGVLSGGTPAGDLEAAGAVAVHADAQAVVDGFASGPLARLVEPRRRWR